jgi:uncharacterized protein with PQ loop repeat
MLGALAIAATVSGLAAGCLPTFQVLKMWRQRSAAGLSLPWLAGALVNSAIWNAYGLVLGNTALILPNALNLLMNVSLTTTALVLGRSRAAVGVAPPVASVAKAVVDDPQLAAEFAALVDAHKADQLAEADTLILRPGTVPALSA